ncbi:sigma-70 family RNA polymerase sigma factor [Intrasporangium sp. YIM S08009]|uniref:sigma-70 family RNA polymerase sigma factor n=1 Tax=Intrasporangium zincisolvens TaxID=3080018 RepID=UPI002B05EF47|nr:sigma-70 family RNA polymerase sigma factor [Intrasporangium sp. YIM S08009]
MDKAERNRLVVDNLPLVGYLVSELCGRATHLSREDLASVGAIGLVLAADAYDPSTGVPFGAYARRRITGALVDELRSLDWAGRGTRQRIKSLQSMTETLAARLGRTPTHDEMAAALGLTREQVRACLADAARTVGPLDGAAEALAAETVAPEDSTLERERVRYLGAAVEALPERLRLIVTQIYLEGRAVKDVAADLGLTSSAVSQQRGEALRLLRGGLELHYADDAHDAHAPGRAGGPDHAAVPTPRRAAYLETLGETVHGLRCVHARPAGVGHPAPAAVPARVPVTVPAAGAVAVPVPASPVAAVPATLEAAG